MKVNDETAVEQPKVIPLEKLATLGAAFSSSVLAAYGGAQTTVGASTSTNTSTNASTNASTTNTKGLADSSAPNSAAPNFGNNFPQAPGPWTNESEVSAAAVRFLLQAQFSASDEEIASVVRQGFANWLDTQLNAPPTTKAWDWLESKGYGSASYKMPAPAATVSHLALWNQLIFSPDAVRQRLALALSEYFVIGLKAIDLFYEHFLAASWWDMLSQESTGNFRSILEKVTLHRAMGHFLNTAGNSKEDPKTGRLPDENYAREIMQLFTIGVYQLNIDGTLKLKNGAPQGTYTNQDITNLARVFTGYGGGWIEGRVGWNMPMRFNWQSHSFLEVNFLGTRIPAGTNPRDALRIALDRLFNHTNTGPFFAKQMIQRLVTSNPSPAYVARVASVFNDNGSGVRGDLKAVWKAILLDSEARNAAGLSSNIHGHVREPMVRFIQWARTFGLQSKSGTWKIGNLTRRLGQSPLMADSVFNFFRPGFVPPNTQLTDQGLLAPELQIVTEQQVADYLNSMQVFIDQGIPVVNAENPNPYLLGQASYDITATYNKELPLAVNASQLVDRIILLLSANQISKATRDQIIKAVNSVSINKNSSIDLLRKRVVIAVFLVMASPEYIVQK